VSSPFETLLRVQDLDTHLSQLRHRRTALPERVELTEVETALGSLDQRIAEAEGRRGGLLARQAELEQHVAAIDQRRQAIEKRMYSDTASAARDLQAMNEEVHHLESRRSELEDVELELMEEQEPVDRELAELAAERSPLLERVATLQVSVAEAETAVDAELRSAEASRATEAAALPPDLAERYEKLRVRLKGTGAARLIGNRCDGCHLELPSVEVERIRHLPPDEVVTCDQCGRILVRGG
jgi:predicted  nucleic acid-binding Zn-ribbon protein